MENDTFNEACTQLHNDWNTQDKPRLDVMELATLEPTSTKQTHRSDHYMGKQRSSDEIFQKKTNAHEKLEMRTELLRAEASINNTMARVLIDAGATHNLVTTSFCLAANIFLDRKNVTKQIVATLLDAEAEVEVYPKV